MHCAFPCRSHAIKMMYDTHLSAYGDAIFSFCQLQLPMCVTHSLKEASEKIVPWMDGVCAFVCQKKHQQRKKRLLVIADDISKAANDTSIGAAHVSASWLLNKCRGWYCSSWTHQKHASRLLETTKVHLDKNSNACTNRINGFYSVIECTYNPTMHTLQSIYPSCTARNIFSASFASRGDLRFIEKKIIYQEE